MNRTAKAVSALLAVLALLLPALPVQAATPAEAGIGFYVRAVLPDNQQDDSLTYFDLRMTPGQEQTIAVEVVNETDQAITVNVAAISASTNRNGVIDYKTPGIRDRTLANPFSLVAAPEAGSITVGPGSAETARIAIRMPGEQYDGVILGGLVFTREDSGEDAAREGMVLNNRYSYVLGVKLSETDTLVRPFFELDSVEAQSVNYAPSMVHLIRNRTAAIAKGITLDVTIRDKDGNVAAQVHRENVDMAPNSVMPLAVTPAAGNGQGEDSRPAGQPAAPDGLLAPGEYTSEVVMVHDGSTHTFRQQFTVGSVQAQQINATVPGRQAIPAGQDNSGILLLLGVAALLIILLLVILIWLVLRSRKRRDA